MSQSGSSAISLMRNQANSVNSQPHQTKAAAKTRVNTPETSSTTASCRGERRGNTSTTKWMRSFIASMAPIMTVQTSRKRAISSVQM